MNYYIGPDGELYHALFGKSKPRDDHKYIKREWKNGRWQYTYKNDSVSGKKSDNKSLSKTAAKPVIKKLSARTNVKDTDDWLSSKTKISNARTGEVIYESRNKGKIERAIDKAKAALGKYTEEYKTDWKESKERADKKAQEKAAKKGASVENTDEFGSHTTTIAIGSVKIVTEKRGKLEQYIETAKEYVKDRLGFDEKEAYDSAKSQQRLTELKKAAATADIKTNARLDNPLADKVIVEAAKAVEKYDEQLKRDTERVESAREDYADTIAGKVELWLEWLSGRGR